MLNTIKDVVWNKGTVLFKLDEMTSQTYRLALGLERFSINRDGNSVLVSFRDVKPVYMLSSHDALRWREPIILYSPDVFKRESLEGIDIIYDTRVDPEVLEIVSKGLSLVNTLRDAYGETIFDPTIFVITSNEVPDPYGHYNGAHNFGSVSYMKQGNRYLYEDVVITIHELAHSWFSSPYTSADPYILKEGGAEFTSWYFGMKYFPEETRSYVERKNWTCRLAKGEHPYMFGATALLVINYYITQLSSLKNENLTVADAIRYIIENINTRSPWSEMEKEFYTTFFEFILEKLPVFLNAELNIPEETMEEASRELYRVIQIEMTAHIVCQWPLYDDYIRGEVDKLVDAIADPSTNAYVYVNYLDDGSLNIDVYNLNPLSLNLLIGLFYTSSGSQTFDIKVPPKTRLVINVQEPVESIVVWYKSFLDGTYYELENVYLPPDTVTVTTTTTVTEAETTTNIITNTVTDTETITKTVAETHTETKSITVTQTVTETDVLKTTETITTTNYETQTLTETITQVKTEVRTHRDTLTLIETEYLPTTYTELEVETVTTTSIKVITESSSINRVGWFGLALLIVLLAIFVYRYLS
ncbi:hypothetical protein apy_12480 [Aeropyrum pernix]|uniref:Uncharacterized protein n=1 Tax=Aeropyrum pernix TaxID=56636 RepID=A0A401HAS4_AERPX|nr:hypothetical protein [Aeropyrum pernix]GBF09523.1 hypothetical protein apy_12480 [Aeropyrum pernix]